MPRKDIQPLYMPYTQNPHAYEYNIFPEFYFCGTDVTLYFNRIKVTQAAAFSCTVQEQHRPVYGYASRTFDQMAIGNRIVVGQIKIPFTDAKYMRNILEKIQKELDDTNVTGSTDALPDNRKFPSWMANALDTHGNAVSPNEFPKVGHVAGVPVLNVYSAPGTNNPIVHTMNKGEAFDILGINTDTDSRCWFNVEHYKIDPTTKKEVTVKGCAYRDFILCREGTGAMPDGIQLVARGEANDSASVFKLQTVLNGISDVTSAVGQIAANGQYDDATFLAVNAFKKSRGLIQDDTGVVGSLTWILLDQA